MDLFPHNSDFAKAYAGLIGDKANSVVFDNSKIKRLVPDFKAEVTAREGIRRTVEYVLAHEECQKADEEFDAWCDGAIAAVKKLQEVM